METTPQPQPDIDVLARVIQLLETIESTNCNKEYNHIRTLTKSYLKQNCIHSIIIDYIDTDIDKSQIIKYCEKCFMTEP